MEWWFSCVESSERETGGVQAAGGAAWSSVEMSLLAVGSLEKDPTRWFLWWERFSRHAQDHICIQCILVQEDTYYTLKDTEKLSKCVKIWAACRNLYTKKKQWTVTCIFYLFYNGIINCLFAAFWGRLRCMICRGTHLDLSVNGVVLFLNEWEWVGAWLSHGVTLNDVEPRSFQGRII